MSLCPSQIEAGELATRFVEAGTAALAKSVPVVLSTDPGWLLESEFIDKFEPDQAIFVLPAMVLDDAPTLARLPGIAQAAAPSGFAA
jgi:hypothetical protein